MAVGRAGCPRHSPATPADDLIPMFDPQTSGGLLISVAPGKVAELTALFAAEGHPCWVVGEVGEGSGVRVLS